jgi:hypothetical protein
MVKIHVKNVVLLEGASIFAFGVFLYYFWR